MTCKVLPQCSKARALNNFSAHELALAFSSRIRCHQVWTLLQRLRLLEESLVDLSFLHLDFLQLLLVYLVLFCSILLVRRHKLLRGCFELLSRRYVKVENSKVIFINSPFAKHHLFGCRLLCRLLCWHDLHMHWFLLMLLMR